MEIEKESYVDPTMPDSTFFHIGQDIKKSTCQSIYKSTVKNDYPSFAYTTKQSRVPSPEQADIFSVEAQINEQKSLTATHFVKQSLAERTPLSKVAKLAFGTKNLIKMDVDNRAMCFDTTHKVYFPARVSEKVKGKDDMMISNIPQGDKEMMLPISNYKQSFQDRQPSKSDVAIPAQFQTPPVLRGDTRSYKDQFETTNSTIFGGQCGVPQQLLPIKNNGCSIRHGDPEKCRYAVTTNQKFFKEKPLERVEPCGPDYVSSVVLGDDRQWCLENYRKKREPLPRVKAQYLISRQAKLDMAKSSVPISDMDLDSAQKRIVTESTSKSSFRKPVVVFPYVKVNGAYLLTDSQIKFGTENGVTQQHYDTTTRSNFPAKYEPVERSDWRTKKSNVSLDYYGNESNQSTTASDFYPHDGVKRLLPNPRRIAELTSSHIQLPKALTSELRTTHNISYPRKQSERQTYEPGKLHKSSIKLGNISVH